MSRRQDAIFVGLSALHGLALVATPVVPLVAIGVWWNSNTIAHNFVHRPFFSERSANRAFAVFQSVLLGIPQALWRQRHLAHHADELWRPRWSGQLALEVALILAVWGTVASRVPDVFATVYLPGYLAGLMLCAMQGHFEHAGTGTISHYGRLYNVLCFNDGYHCEHHAYPGVHWSELPGRRVPDPRVSRWPALLRWLDACSLDGLERLVLRSTRLQRFVVRAHSRAFKTVLSEVGPINRVAVIGGGLFPRTALVLRELFPSAHLVLIDADQHHLDQARALLGHTPLDVSSVEFRHDTFVAGDRVAGVDLVVVPLALRGDRRAVYHRPPGPSVIVHEWCWRPRGRSRLVSLALLKRVNLIASGIG